MYTVLNQHLGFLYYCMYCATLATRRHTEHAVCTAKKDFTQRGVSFEPHALKAKVGLDFDRPLHAKTCIPLFGKGLHVHLGCLYSYMMRRLKIG